MPVLGDELSPAGWGCADGGEDKVKVANIGMVWTAEYVVVGELKDVVGISNWANSLEVRPREVNCVKTVIVVTMVAVTVIGAVVPITWATTLLYIVVEAEVDSRVRKPPILDVISIVLRCPTVIVMERARGDGEGIGGGLRPVDRWQI